MKLAQYNAFCRGLPHTSHVVQWGDAEVWKVAGKVFCLGRASEDGRDIVVSFKCSAVSFDLLTDRPGLRPAPYLASRGLSWIQRYSAASMDDAALRDYLKESYRLVAAGLPKRVQATLGLNDAVATAKSVTTPSTRRGVKKPSVKTTGKKTSPKAASHRSGRAATKTRHVTKQGGSR